MARLHEYQGKAILAATGFKIPRGAVSVVNIKNRPFTPLLT
jgi:succinyl-CoA synthetase beta subunit